MRGGTDNIVNLPGLHTGVDRVCSANSELNGGRASDRERRLQQGSHARPRINELEEIIGGGNDHAADREQSTSLLRSRVAAD